MEKLPIIAKEKKLNIFQQIRLKLFERKMYKSHFDINQYENASEYIKRNDEIIHQLIRIIKYEKNYSEQATPKEIIEMKEKENIMAMKVSQLGLKPDESPVIDEQDQEEDVTNPDIRFAKLHEIDLKYEDYEQPDYENSFTLPELCENFRNFSASKLKLYYKLEMLSILEMPKKKKKNGIEGRG